MGNWTITIHGTGSHHNKKHPTDANRMATRFADELRAAGHNVEHASFTHGGRDDLIDANSLVRTGYYDREPGDA